MALRFRHTSNMPHPLHDRFTDRARKVMQLANYESQRFQHEYIGTEHILLGLIKEGSGVAAHVLKGLGVELANVRQEIEKLIQRGPQKVALGRLPQTPRAKHVIELAIEEAKAMNHNYVGSEHLLLGLLGEPEGVAAVVLMNLGIHLENVREQTKRLLGNSLIPNEQAAAVYLPQFSPQYRDVEERAVNHMLSRINEGTYRRFNLVLVLLFLSLLANAIFVLLLCR
jgi:ATP-dependent Clp protease ATP-binding subunit ClpA